VVEAFGRQLDQELRQFDRGRRGRLEEGVVIGQLQHLPIGGLGQLLAAIADIHAPEPGHAVDEAPALGIPKMDAIGPGDDPHALAIEERAVGEGVEVVGAIERLPFGGAVPDRCREHE
jgi:hypothetical protein